MGLNLFVILRLGMNRMVIKRTNSDNPDFQILASELEADLKIRDGEDYALYGQLNKISWLSQVIVVYEQNEVAGCGAFRHFDTSTQEIKRMFVRPAFRGQGVATRILKELENWCFELGFRHCILETGKNQPEAIEFYKKNGYVKISNYGQYMDSEYSVCFKKAL